jgi:hypothetical protein
VVTNSLPLGYDSSAASAAFNELYRWAQQIFKSADGQCYADEWRRDLLLSITRVVEFRQKYPVLESFFEPLMSKLKSARAYCIVPGWKDKANILARMKQVRAQKLSLLKQLETTSNAVRDLIGGQSESDAVAAMVPVTSDDKTIRCIRVGFTSISRSERRLPRLLDDDDSANDMNSSCDATVTFYAAPLREIPCDDPITDAEHTTFSRRLDEEIDLRYGSSQACRDLVRTAAACEDRSLGLLVFIDLSDEGDGGKYLPEDCAGIRHVRVGGGAIVSRSGLGVLIAMWLCKMIHDLLDDGNTVLVHCDNGHSR